MHVAHIATWCMYMKPLKKNILACCSSFMCARRHQVWAGALSKWVETATACFMLLMAERSALMLLTSWQRRPWLSRAFSRKCKMKPAKLRAGRWGGHTAIATYSPSECVPVCLRKLCKKLSSFLLFCSACRVLVLICSFLFCGGRCATKARMASASITDREFLYKKCNKRCSYLVNEVGIKEVNSKTK